ncbi:MAG: DUF6550 family protein [Clostridia bacterium]
MKKDYNTKKKATIIALSLTAVCLAGGLFYYVSTLGGGEPPTTPVESQPTTESQIVVPEIKPNDATAQGDSTNSGDVQDKPSDGKPKTPEAATPPAEPPKTEDGKDRTPPPAESGKDHEFTPEAPDQKPEYKPEQTQPNNNAGKPKDGDTKDGKIYIDGFGWIENEGGGSDVKDAPNAGTGKPVGEM